VKRATTTVFTVLGCAGLFIALLAVATTGFGLPENRSESIYFLSDLHTPAPDVKFAEPALQFRAEPACGPTVSCLPVLLPPGGFLIAFAIGPNRDIDLPRHAVDLWHPLPAAPVPIV
jgi:hypothetical protein